jgi:hypothetical protein
MVPPFLAGNCSTQEVELAVKKIVAQNQAHLLVPAIKSGTDEERLRDTPSVQVARRLVELPNANHLQVNAQWWEYPVGKYFIMSIYSNTCQASA